MKSTCTIKVQGSNGNTISDRRKSPQCTEEHRPHPPGGTGLQHQARLESIGTHGFDDLRVSSIQIEEDVAGIAAVGIRPKVNVESLAIATTQKAYNRRLRELIGRPESLSRAAASGDRMNQTEQIKFVGHGRDLAADSVQGDKQSALHARKCNMLPKTSLAKPEVSTLQKTGSFYFALTGRLWVLTFDDAVW